MGHPARFLLSKHTGEMSSQAWVASIVANAMLYGNGWSKIIRNRAGDAIELEFVPSVLVSVERLPNTLNRKRVHINHQERGIETLPESEMFNLQGLSFSNLGGVPLIALAINTIGRMLSAEGFADDFFSNSGVPSGWLMHPMNMSQEAQERFIAAVEQRHSGPGKRHRIGLLEEGMTWQQTGIPPEDALLVDFLQMGVKDIARFFKLPPHKLGDDGKTSFNSVAEENRGYFNSCLGSWVNRFEAEANCKLISRRKWESHFVKFDTDEIFQAPFKERMEGNAVAVTNGILSRNEVREKEGLNPYEGGDEYLTPLNMSPGAEPAEDMDPVADVGDDVRAAARDVLSRTMRRGVRRICNEATTAAKKNPSSFLANVNRLEGRMVDTFIDEIDEAVRLAESCGSTEWDSRKVADLVFRYVTDSLIAASEQGPQWVVKNVRDSVAPLETFADELATKILKGMKHEQARTP